MASVKFARPFSVDGHQFPKGVAEVPDRFLDRLPSSAEVLSGKEAAKAKAQAEAKAQPPQPRSLSEHRKASQAPAKPMGK